MVISHWVVINKKGLSRDNTLLKDGDNLSPGELYNDLHCKYPKFFKMDKLCKWAWIAAEYLLSGNDLRYERIDKHKIALALTTSQGCLDVDQRYYESIGMPSPSLFVYTLPNIMLGEISIRHGFKGEQVCLIREGFDAPELHFITEGLVNDNDMDACLCGWVNVADEGYDICLLWITREGKGVNFTSAALQELYNYASYTSQGIN